MTTDANGLTLSNQSDSGYLYCSTLVNMPGKFIAFAKVPIELRADCHAFKATTDNNIFGYDDTVVLGVFDDSRDAAFVGQTFCGTSFEDRNNNLVELFSGNTSVIPTIIPTWDHPANVVAMAAGAARKATRATSRKMGARVPTGSLASVKAKLTAMFPNATPAKINAAALSCVKLSGGATYISELDLA